MKGYRIKMWLTEEEAQDLRHRRAEANREREKQKIELKDRCKSNRGVYGEVRQCLQKAVRGTGGFCRMHRKLIDDEIQLARQQAKNLTEEVRESL